MWTSRICAVRTVVQSVIRRMRKKASVPLVLFCRHCQQGFDPLDRVYSLARRFHDLLQFFLLCFLQLSELFFSWPSHRWLLPASFSLSLPPFLLFLQVNCQLTQGNRI